MNDRFRFRAWNTKTHKLKEVTAVITHYAQHGFPSDVEDKIVCNLWYQPHLVLEQCTGLKDKNGRLIYEGDIISIFGGSQYEIVEWSEERLGYFVEVQLSAGADFGPECLRNLRDVIEVIGNIHENPELLEEAQNG